MRTLSSEDAFFLFMETPDQHQHTVGTLVMDPSSAPAGFTPHCIADKLEQFIEGREEFRQKLVKTPFSITPPVLVEDPAFRFADHIHYIAVPAPGGESELATLVQDIASTPLDHRRPLWETWIVSGLSGDKLALVFKSHHCLTDAAHGMAFMSQLFDLEPKLPKQKSRGSPRISSAPPAWLVTYEAMKSQWLYQPRYRDVISRTWRSVNQRRKMFSQSAKLADLVPAFLESAPKLKINRPITSLRSAAMAAVDLDEIKRIKNYLGVTVNDVVVSACTLALREYLVATDDLPDQPLVCYIPVSLMMKGQQAAKEDQGNQVGTMAVRLPVQLEDPAAVARAVTASTHAAKEVFDASFENLLLGYIGMVPPVFADWALKQYLSGPVVEVAPATTNVVISNFPGPPMDLYIAGAKLEGCYPMGPIINGQGPNITFMSCAGKLQFSVQACRDHIPDASVITEGIVSGFAKLGELVDQGTKRKSRQRKVAAKTRAKKATRAAPAVLKKQSRINPAADRPA